MPFPAHEQDDCPVPSPAEPAKILLINIFVKVAIQTFMSQLTLLFK